LAVTLAACAPAAPALTRAADTQSVRQAEEGIMTSKAAGLLLVVLAALFWASVAPAATVVYENDFQIGAGWEWSNPVVTSTPLPPDGSRRFLGQFGPPDGGGSFESSVTLTLGGLPLHTELSIEFDLYIMQSWDGNFPAVHGPDTWSLEVLEGGVLLYTTFNNQPFYFESQYPDQSQSFSGLMDSLPDTYTGDISTTPIYCGQTGSVEAGTLGYQSHFGDVGTQPTSSVYHMHFDLLHDSASVAFMFSSSVVNEDLGPDPERWGLDNVVVTVDEGVVPVEQASWGKIKSLYR